MLDKKVPGRNLAGKNLVGKTRAVPAPGAGYNK